MNSPRNPSASNKNATAAGGCTNKHCFGPEGCPAVANGRRCGETKNLQIIQEFRRLYEDKMKQIDDAAGGDCIQAKINLQQEWIRDLTDQNEMLVRVVEELEVEAAERVTMLEDKLQQSAKCACEVMGSYKDFSINFLADFQKLEYVQNDLNNLIEIVRRAKHRGVWNTKDLSFYTINIDEVIDGDRFPIEIDNRTESDCKCVGDGGGGTSTNCKNDKILKDKERKMKELEEKIKKLNEAADRTDDSKKTCQDLKKSMLDMRDALTAEVADKHDTILCLRREVHMLEEQCRKADQQTSFKDDIIKELRKEIKQLKLQAKDAKSLIQNLSEENSQLFEEIKLLRIYMEHIRTALLKREMPTCSMPPKASNCYTECPGTRLLSKGGTDNYSNLTDEKEVAKLLNANLENEVRNVLEELHSKNTQLSEHNELVARLVQKLFSVYKNLRKLSDNTVAMRFEEEKENLLRKIRTLEADNELLKETVIKVKKNLDKLEEKAENYLEERDDVKRKHRESLETIETLQRENMRSKEELMTLEDEKKSNVNKLQQKLVQELESYEKKHRDSMDKLETLRGELDKYKSENNSSLIKVKTLSDENRSQAETITSLKEQVRKSEERPPTTSTGVNARAHFRDTGVDPYPPHTKHVGIAYSPDMRSIGTISDIENQIIPNYMFKNHVPRQYRTIACETEYPNRLRARRATGYETTSTCDEDEPGNAWTAVKPPTVRKKKDAVEILEIIEPTTLDAYDCGSKITGEVFDFVPHRLTATADGKTLQELAQLEMIEKRRAGRSRSPVEVSDRLQLVKSRPKSSDNSGKTEVLFNANHMYQTSNESMISDNSAVDPREVFNSTFLDKPFKSVRIDPKPIEDDFPRKREVRQVERTGSDDIAATYFSAEDGEESHRKKDVGELHAPIKSGLSSRPLSPKRSAHPGAHATEDLQNVVQDLNESVSRIIEKTPNDKACREKIAKLEAQLRAALKLKEKDVEAERQKRNQEVENLKLTIREMEKALQNKQENAVNLQSAVDLYLNSIGVLEQSEDRYRNEVTQQRVTISNLQEALVATKQQLDELQKKCQRDLEEKFILLNILDVSLSDLEQQCYHYYDKYLNSTLTIDYLRDEVLDLEMEKFELTQDVLVLEARLLKYQQISKRYECICGLKREIKRLHVEVGLFKGEVDNLQNYIGKCHQEIDSAKTILGKYLGQECSEYCIKQNESVVTLAQDTICYTEDLQCQLSVLETALKREQKINIVQTTRIEELQAIIGAKTIELSRTNDAYLDVKAKLDAAVTRSKNLEDSIDDLQEQLKDMEMDNMYQEEKSDICHGELDICLNNLQSVKLKLRGQYKAMCQKMQDFTKLQADCKIQTNNAEMFKRDLENTRIRCRDEIIELKHTIRDLKEKLNDSEDKIDSLNKEVKQSQALLVEASHHETKVKQDFHMREKQLTEKIHSAQDEEMRLLDIVTQLEQEIIAMKNELDSKDVQLESAKQTILQMNSDGMMKQHVNQDEINKLKNEVNALLQQQGAQKADNERLQQQIECMKCCVRQNESDSKSIRLQLDKCVNDLKLAEQEKSYLEQRNATLMATLDRMQATIQSKTESLAHMEVELLDAKTSRDEICTESRNVVFNVRSWLDEQKKINEELKARLEKKNALIAKYEHERRKSKCDCCQRTNCQRQRGGSIQSGYIENNAPPLSRSPWSLDSRGSGSESPTSSVSSTAADWYEYEEVGYDAVIEDPSAELWIHRVESMTEELQRSNRYWKRKINDSEFMVTKDK